MIAFLLLFAELELRLIRSGSTVLAILTLVMLICVQSDLSWCTGVQKGRQVTSLKIGLLSTLLKIDSHFPNFTFSNAELRYIKKKEHLSPYFFLQKAKQKPPIFNFKT